MIVQPEQFLTYSLQNSPIGNDICKVLAAAINSIDAGQAVKKHIIHESDKLVIGNLIFDLRKFDRIIVIGIGKAVLPMAVAISEVLGDCIASGLLITTGDYPISYRKLINRNIKILKGDHPIPTHKNIVAGKNLTTYTKGMKANDLVIFLLSGGGSALLIDPSPGITLDDIQTITTLMLNCGAPITEINTLRKHLDDFKGGGLAKRLYPATIVSLILSDVIGDDLSVIASGPTTDDPTTFKDAWNVLSKYHLIDQVTGSVIERISSGIKGEITETIKLGDPILLKVFNILIGNNNIAMINACDEANRLGYRTEQLTSIVQGEASLVGMEAIDQVKNSTARVNYNSQPACWIGGGETTVTIHGIGLGGRNQELALGAVSSLSGSQKTILVSLATDGRDGPTNAAGAVATTETFSRCINLGMNPQDYLDRNDSYHFFEALRDLIKIGPTLTNVNDLVAIFKY